MSEIRDFDIAQPVRMLPFGMVLAVASLTFAGLVVGLAAVFLFDAAFLLFHQVFFPQGNFSFDPRTERLTQLFPDQFWSETVTLVAIVGVAIALAMTLVARRLDRQAE